MVKHINSKALLILCVLCVASTASAKSYLCNSGYGIFQYDIPNLRPNLENSDFFKIDEDAIDLLKSDCVEIDQSAGNIHEEDNAVDLTCFDCIVGELPDYDAKESPWNGRSFVE